MGSEQSRAAGLAPEARAAGNNAGASTTQDGSSQVQGLPLLEPTQNSQDEPEPPDALAAYIDNDGDQVPATDAQYIPGDARFVSNHQKAMFIACMKSDYDLAKFIVKSDTADPITNRGKATTLKGDYRKALVKCMAVLHAMPQNFKLACIMHQLTIELSTGTLNGYLPPDYPASSSPDTDKFPLVYVNILAGTNGLPPSLEQWKKLADAAIRYSKDVVQSGRKFIRRQQSEADGRWVRSVDECVPTGRPSGYQYVFSSQTVNSQRKYIQHDTELDHIKHWAKLVKNRIADIRQRFPQLSLTSPCPLVHAGDVGYTGRPCKRRYEHESHDHSINPMNLIDSIARIELGAEWKVRYRNILWVLTEDLVSMTEHVVTRLCCTYATQGGFNRKAAGHSVQSADKVTGHQYTLIQKEYARRFMQAFKREADITEQALAAAKDEAELRDMQKHYERRHEELQVTNDTLDESVEKYKEAIADADRAADTYVEAALAQLSLIDEMRVGLKWCDEAEADLRHVWDFFKPEF